MATIKVQGGNDLPPFSHCCFIHLDMFCCYQDDIRCIKIKNAHCHIIFLWGWKMKLIWIYHTFAYKSKSDHSYSSTKNTLHFSTMQWSQRKTLVYLEMEPLATQKKIPPNTSEDTWVENIITSLQSSDSTSSDSHRSPELRACIIPLI